MPGGFVTSLYCSALDIIKGGMWIPDCFDEGGIPLRAQTSGWIHSLPFGLVGGTHSFKIGSEQSERRIVDAGTTSTGIYAREEGGPLMALPQ